MKKLVVIMMSAVCLFSCKKDNDEAVGNEIIEATETGTYFINEGNFMMSNASISYLNASGELSSDPFLAVNGFSLGDVLTSFLHSNGKGYAVLNNSNKVEVFDLYSWESLSTISDVVYPRHIISGGNGKLYLSSGAFAGIVTVINESTLSIEATIAVGNGPERMAISNGKLFVCNSGGWLEDNSVSIIDLNTNTVSNTLVVGDRPVDIEIDMNGDVWVMCQGKTVYSEDWSTIIEETKTKLVKIDGGDASILFSEELGEVGDHGSVIEVNGNGTKLYYALNGVWTLSTTDAVEEGQFVTGNYSSIDCNSSDEVWLTSVSNFVNPSIIYRYTPTGNLLEQFTSGIGTNAVVFF